MECSKSAKPFLKWAGGKSRIAKTIASSFPHSFNCYFEPFLGSGAVYFEISPQTGILNDSNKMLIGTYEIIKEKPLELIKEMSSIENEYNLLSSIDEKAAFYYNVRKKYNARQANDIIVAAQFIFLNKAGWNGMYRENAKGNFNIPFGKREKLKIYEKETIMAVSKDVQRIDFMCGDYKDAALKAKKGDLIYFDPPYVPLTDLSFTAYQKEGFGEKEQIELRDLALELANRGCFVAISNSDCGKTRDLYKDFRIKEIPIMRTIGAKNYSRKRINEILAISY